MLPLSIAGVSPLRAMRAREAGAFLAALVGLSEPVSAAKMWRYARLGRIKAIQMGRHRYFRTVDLEQFVTNGGCGAESMEPRV